jgi:hypothetical protein
MGIINYKDETRVLVSVKGHPYPRDAFFELLDSINDVAYTAVEQPATQYCLQPDAETPWNALLFYDMPGIDFSTQPPGFIPPSERFQRDLLAHTELGTGMVFMHHAVAGWPLWPEYGALVGGRFFYAPQQDRGVDTLDSGYRHDVAHTVSVLAPDHPVAAGIPSTFELTDELYLSEIYDDTLIPLLASNYVFDSEHFYSAAHAVNGRMYCNDEWPHPPGKNIIGWVKHYQNSPVVYLQPGDGANTFANPHYRQLVSNAIHWVASDAAKDWARTQNAKANQ